MLLIWEAIGVQLGQCLTLSLSMLLERYKYSLVCEASGAVANLV